METQRALLRQVEWNIRDGDLITKGQQFGTVKGLSLPICYIRSVLFEYVVLLNFDSDAKCD